MPSRVIAFVLALVLLWSAVTTIEPPRAMGHAALEQSYATAEGGTPSTRHEGSIDDHHLDDLPGQPQSDPPPEPLGLLAHSMVALFDGGQMSRPTGIASLGLALPFLDGLLRPPCRSALAG
jgi:hypothetical protein